MSTEMPDFTSHVTGGYTPSVTDLASSAISDVTDNLGPYALAGLGLSLLNIVVLFIAIPLTYLGVGFGVMAGMFGGGAIGIAALAVNETLGLILTSFLPFIGMFVGMMLPIAALSIGLTFITAPVGASMYRAIAERQRGGEELTIASAFSSLGTNVVGVIGTTLLFLLFFIPGIMMCYIPGFIVSFALHWAIPAAALHNRSPLEAVMQSIKHVQENTLWHLGFWGLGIAIAMISGYIPVIGQMVLFSYIIKGYRAAFGDGPEPYQT